MTNLHSKFTETEILNLINNQFGKVLKHVIFNEAGTQLTLIGYKRSYKKVREAALDLVRSGMKVKSMKTNEDNPFILENEVNICLSF